MELLLTHHSATQVLVTCDDQPSHTFDRLALTSSAENSLPQIKKNPVVCGTNLYTALFKPDTLARHALDEKPERIMLVTSDEGLHKIPWEYIYGPDGFLVLHFPFVRGLAREQRIAPPKLESGLYIIAIPSQPLDHDIPALDIEAEWHRLKESIESVPYALTLERTHPPTLGQVQHLLVNQHHCILHFMGHGDQDETGAAVLCFEQFDGQPERVTAENFIRSIGETTFLVTLNACVSAAPGETPFSNLALSLVRQRIPYALGMRTRIDDRDARIFSQSFYDELARGISVEEALRQARVTLAREGSLWAIGVPVLYTALESPNATFPSIAGSPTVKEHRPATENAALPDIEGVFQGRIDELKDLGKLLTGDQRPQLVTIHGGGGQGKTALVRKAVERFTYAWTGGVWATSLENLPSREKFVNDLARFIGVPTHGGVDLTKTEHQMLTRLASKQTLIVLDNAETLVDAVKAANAEAIDLVQFIQQLPNLLVTSRVLLEWKGERVIKLRGLSPAEGARLFSQSTSPRADNAELSQVRELSRKLDGHPLALLLLGKTFSASDKALREFLREYARQLTIAKNTDVCEDHRHHTLSACINVSTQYLDADQRILLRGLCVFHAPFLAESAVALFDPESKETPSPVYQHLDILWQRGLLTRKTVSVDERAWDFYQLLPTTRFSVEHFLNQAYDREKIQTQFGAVYLPFVRSLYEKFNQSAAAVAVAQQISVDLERAAVYVTGIEQGYYWLSCGWILHRLGDSRRGQIVLEQALEMAQERGNQALELVTRTQLAEIHRATGQLPKALEICQRALSIAQQVSKEEEAATRNIMGLIYQSMGQPKQALSYYEDALATFREVGNLEREAITLTNLGPLCQQTGQPEQALKNYEDALVILRKLGLRAELAAALNNVASLSYATGQPEKALQPYNEALCIMREMGDRAGEATTLTNIGLLKQDTGQPQEALRLYEEALSIQREIGNLAGEATTLNSMATAYQYMGQLERALKRAKEALRIWRKVGDQSGVATALGNIGLIHWDCGRRDRALRLFEKLALPIVRKIGEKDKEGKLLNNIGLVYREMGQLQDALRYYEQALSLRRQVHDLVGEATTLGNMAGVYRAMGEMTKALDFYAKALSIRKGARDRGGEANTLNSIARVYQDTGRLSEALQSSKQALRIQREAHDLAGEAGALNNIGLVSQRRGQMKEALRYYEQALSLLQEIQNPVEEAKTRHNIAVLYRATGQPQKALEYYKANLLILKDGETRVITLNNMAVVYMTTGRLPEALQCYEQALSIAREIRSKAVAASILNHMALVYQSMGKLDRALQMYQEALSIAREIGDRAREATIRSNIGQIKQGMGQLDEAFQDHTEALAIIQELDEPAGKAIILNNIGMVYRAKKQPQEALKYFQDALQLHKAVENRADKATTSMNIAVTYLDIGQPEKALPLCEETLFIQREVSNRAGEATTLTNMSAIYQALGQPEKALQMCEEALPILQQVGERAGEAAVCTHTALLLYRYFQRAEEAIAHLERAITLLVETGLPQDAAGRKVEELQRLLEKMRAGVSLA
jgi:tetratricopeptide (TPR) repeat protein